MAAAGVPLLISLAVTAATTAATYFLTPKPKTPDPIDVGKLDDPRVTGSEYGAFIPRFWGTVRMGGNIIWSSGVDHQIIDYPSQGGKGGTPPAPATRVHIYTSSFGMLLGRTQVDSWGRIWADENLIVGAVGENVKTFQADDPNFATPLGDEGDNWDYVTDANGTYIILRRFDGVDAELLFDLTSCELPPLPPSADPDEKDSATVSPRTKVTFYYQSNGISSTEMQTDTGAGVNIREVSFAKAPLYWTTRTFEFDGDLESLNFVVEDVSFGDTYFRLDKIVCEKYWYIIPDAQGNEFLGSITGIADPDNAYATDGDDITGYFSYVPTADAQGTTLIPSSIVTESFRLYSGTETALKDSYLISYLDTKYGSGNGTNFTPAHRGLAWISFKNYGLRRGRVPSFSVEVTNDADTINEMLTELAGDVGLVAGDLELTATAGLDFIGYLESQKTSRKAHFDGLSKFYGFRYAEIDGKIKTVLDTFTPITTISQDLVRAANGTDTPKGYDAEILKMPSYEMPREVRFTVSNPALDYLKETATAQLTTGTYANDVAEFSFPIVASSEQARKRAESMLLKLHAEAKAVTFSAMPALMRYSVGDVLTIPLNGSSYVVRIDRKTSTLPVGAVEIQGTILEVFEAGDIETAIVPTEISTLTTYQQAFVQAPRNAIAIPFISKPIRESDVGRLGMYVAVTPVGNGISETVSLYQEIADDTYNLREIYEVPSAAGVALEALGNWATPSTEDTTNYVDIYFFNKQSLESVTGADLDRNPQLNLMRVGDEWVQFRTATIQSLDPDSVYRSKWRISNLRRGLFGTTGEIGSHAANEYCVLNTNNLRFYDLDEADRGEVIKFKAVAGGGNLEMSPVAEITFNPLSAYTVTNATDDRSFDADCTTIDELADVVATIIKDTNL